MKKRKVKGRHDDLDDAIKMMIVVELEAKHKIFLSY